MNDKLYYAAIFALLALLVLQAYWLLTTPCENLQKLPAYYVRVECLIFSK